MAANDESVFCVQGVNEELVCRNHLILGQHLYRNLEGRDFDLYGGAKLRSKGNKVRLHLSSWSMELNVLDIDDATSTSAGSRRHLC